MRIPKRPATRLTMRLAIFAIGLAVVVGGLGVMLNGVGKASLEAWVGQRIKTVAADALKPTLDFESLDYQAPFTVVLHGVTLTADDPDNVGQRIPIITVKTFQLELAELPKQGEPLKLASAYFGGGVVRLVATQDGGLVGFSDMTDPADGGDIEQLVSEILQIDEVVIDDCTVVYDTRQPGTEPMQIDKIDTVVRIDSAHGGLYGIDLSLDREGVFDLQYKGGLDLDRMALALDRVSLDLEIARERDHLLPPQVQRFVKEHELTGAMSLEASGEIVFEDVFASDLQFTLKLEDAYGTRQGVRLPIETLAIEGSVSDAALRLDAFNAQALGGEIEGVARLALREPRVLSAAWAGDGLRLRAFLPLDAEGNPPAQATGKLDVKVQATAPIDGLLTQVAGRGRVDFRDGKVAGLPIVSALVAFMESRGEVERVDGVAVGTDTGQLVFEFRGDHAYLSKYEMDASWFAMRGRGKFFFDQRVAMNINAGPLQKVQNALGLVGRLVGGVTDRALVYRVRGKVGALSVVPVPLGGVVGAPGDDESAEDFLEPREVR